MLTFEKSAIDEIVGQHRPTRPEDNQECSKHGAWGCETITSNTAGLTGKFWLIPGIGVQDRTPGNYGTNTNESIHPIARLRKQYANLNSPPLKNFTAERVTGAPGWEWRKNGTPSIAEYVVRKKDMMSVSFGGDEGDEPIYKSEESLSRRLCPEGKNCTLSGLDQDNGL
jgi:hypothetical protein